MEKVNISEEFARDLAEALNKTEKKGRVRALTAPYPTKKLDSNFLLRLTLLGK